MGKSAQLDSQSAVCSVEFQEDEFAEKLVLRDTTRNNTLDGQRKRRIDDVIMTERSPVIPDRARRTIAVDVLGVAGAATVDAEHTLHVADDSGREGSATNSAIQVPQPHFGSNPSLSTPVLFAWPSHTLVQLQHNGQCPC